MSSAPLEPEVYDCVAIVTNHSAIDYAELVQRGKVIVDFRNATKGHEIDGKVWKLVTSVGVVGLNYWGPNLVRNFHDIADLTWVCDLDQTHLDAIAARYPSARATTSFDELLADDALDAVVIATPVPTHYELAKQALAAGKHVFVEKPPAMRAAEMDELVSLAGRAGSRADAGSPPALPPRRAQGEAADRQRRARRRALRLRQPRQSRHRALERERALVARRARPLGDPLLPRRGPGVRDGAGKRVDSSRRRGCRLLLPALPERQDRAHAPLLARSAQDAEDDGRRSREDGRVRRHGAGAEGDRLRETRGRRRRASLRRHLDPQDRDDRAAAARVQRTSSSSSAASTTRPRSRATVHGSCGRSRC